MNVTKNNFYVISGGPGAGKTTLIEALEKRGFKVVHEVARQILQEQIKSGGDATHWKNQVKYRDLMLSRSIETFMQITEQTQPVFFDRGIPELWGYSRFIKADMPDSLYDAIQLFRYNQKVFITPPWQEIYQHDAERKLSWQEAVDTYHRVINSYEESGYRIIEIPKSTVDERIDFILQEVEN